VASSWRVRIAAVVDTRRDIDQYLAFAAEHDLRIAHVFLTHFHADFIAGHLELRDRTGAKIYLGAAAQAEYQFTPPHDVDVVEFGKVRLKALETPGHTAESISLVVYDLDRSATEPQAVLTGDTLFIGDVGRPDVSRSVGWPVIWEECSTIRCGKSCSPCRIRRRSSLPTVPDRCEGRR
jgi:hydroxyacylglutathione hydrolase